MNDGNYWVTMTLKNDCGQETEIYQPFSIGTPSKSQAIDSSQGSSAAYGDKHIVEISGDRDDGIFISTANSLLIIDNQSGESKQCTVLNHLGQIVYDGNIDDNYMHQLSSGIYYILITSDNGLRSSHKILIL